MPFQGFLGPKNIFKYFFKAIYPDLTKTRINNKLNLSSLLLCLNRSSSQNEKKNFSTSEGLFCIRKKTVDIDIEIQDHKF